MRLISGFLFLIGAIIVLQNCNDPAYFGTDILKQDSIKLNYIDTFQLEAQTVLDTGIVVYNYTTVPFVFNNRQAVGNFYDPVFGNTESRLYFQFKKPSSAIPANYKDGKIDSVILYLAVDTSFGNYGKKKDPHDFEINQLSTILDRNQNFVYNDYSLPLLGNLVGSFPGVIPDFTTYPRVVQGPDTNTFQPHLAFKLSDQFADYIKNLDTLYYNSDSIFLSSVRGLCIRQTNLNANMLSFNTSSRSTGTKMTVYYHKPNDTANYYYNYDITSILCPKVPQWNHSHSPSIVSSLNSVEKGNQLIYLESLGGLKTKIRLPKIKIPPASLINKAELVFTVIDLPQDDTSTYHPPLQLAFYKSDTILGVYNFISDQGGQANYYLAGGNLTTTTQNGLTTRTYSLNLSSYLQRYVAGLEGAEIFLKIAPVDADQTSTTGTSYASYKSLLIPENLSRVVLGGPKHKQYPCKLRISYTTY